MRLSAVVTLAAFSVQFCFLDEASGQLLRGKRTAEEHSAASARGRKTPASPHEGDGGRGMRRQPSVGLQKVEGSAGSQDRRQSKGVSQPQRGVSKLAAESKKPSPQLSPPKRKHQALQNHLKGHGKFNPDTSKTCKRPSDCDGCLGLYTCKLPRGKCDLKAVSRETGILLTGVVIYESNSGIS
uniref:Uncharacterized protein n=1 Tax=Sphaerodactylus townsendi TaxID=933632 RepID=A0ACB8FN59_9SAUR